MWQKLKVLIDEKIIRHFRESHAPVEELSMASAVGVFWAMTPLVGIQMYLVTFSWFLFRLLQIRFSLPLALAWTWVSNPLTVPVFYYSFYITGYWTFSMLGLEVNFITFRYFEEALTEAANLSFLQGLFHWGEFLLNELGWASLVGGYIMAIPSAIVAYPLSRNLINRYRKVHARHMNISLKEWEERFVYKTRLEKARARIEKKEKRNQNRRSKRRKKNTASEKVPKPENPSSETSNAGKKSRKRQSHPELFTT